MANLNHEHLKLLCELNDVALKRGNLSRTRLGHYEDLRHYGLVESIEENDTTFSQRLVQLTERGHNLLIQLELELNKAVMK